MVIPQPYRAQKNPSIQTFVPSISVTCDVPNAYGNSKDPLERASPARRETQSIALGINNTGLIIGKSQIKVNNVMTWHGFVVSNQGTPGSQALINLNDMIPDPNDPNKPWVAVYTGGVFVFAASQGWVLTNAEKVNDGNIIVGYRTKAGAGVRAFVLEPR